MKQKTIGASEGAYEVVMAKKQAMEQARRQTVSMREALDKLLEERIDG